MEFGFGPERRLLKPSDYKPVFKQAKIRSAHPNLLILAKENNRDHARLGLVFAKKHIKKAVQRNRCKRIVRESFRLNPKLPNLDIVVLARPGLGELTGPVLQAILQKQWARVRKNYEKAHKSKVAALQN